MAAVNKGSLANKPIGLEIIGTFLKPDSPLSMNHIP